ncbi:MULTISPECIES: DUF202 domain-containing protein [Aestuariimicrobium]|uniref:DUF202 domain-containing protein n=1 Tax=Aestuariimicrobium TaxID=396388 RepID=UPI0003B59FD5|nr:MULTISPECIES: DUF202 domain-containing protein [Aestuariimicrobium]CAI9404939.1 hypothetical protein AESSP_01313 [Aestuariimicrobium sp. T2.26MG-19.2B]
MTTERVWDAGLQPERTALAWRRIGLAVIGVGLAVPRLTWPSLGAWSIPAGLCALVVGVVALHQSLHRYRRAHTTLTTEDVPRLPSGRGLLMVMLTVLLTGLTALAALVVQALGLGAAQL